MPKHFIFKLLEKIKNQENLNNEKHKSSYLNYNSICTFANKNKSLNLGMKTKLTSLIILLFIVVSCNTDCTVNKDISNIPMDVEVVRFDKAFAEATTEDLPQLKTAFPELFSSRIPDSIWVNKINDTLQNELESEVIKTFPDFIEETNDISTLFKHIKYHFPEFKKPTVITVTSDVDYRNKVIVADRLLLIALDNYLGTDHRFYVGIQEYLKDNFRKAQIVPNIAQEYANQLVPRPTSRTFLAQMVYYGKLLYLQDVFLPCTNPNEKIGYSKEDYQWALDNEEQIWRYFIEKELIYKTSNKLQERFINEGPFSKFYLQLDAESPSKLGQYIGWQIVKQYMDKHPVSLKKLLITDAETIFKTSKYKPKK